MSGGRAAPPQVLVVGHIARDLVVRVAAVPAAGGSVAVRERREILGGKGANQAVALAQLGLRPAVLGAVGDDAAGEDVLRQAELDGVDVRAVVRRGVTALLLDVTGDDGPHLLEHVTEESLLRVEDVRLAEDLIAATPTVSLQLQQPGEALLAAGRVARASGARVVLDGAGDPDARDELLALADVVRADANEAARWAGHAIADRDDARRAARALIDRGAGMVCLGIPGVGDFAVWRDGEEFLPHEPPDGVVDPTGAGDAFTAALIAALHAGAAERDAARAAAAAAADTVRRLGGRPALRPERVGLR